LANLFKAGCIAFQCRL